MQPSTQAGLYLPTGEAILIDKARKGKDCDCVCLDCGRPLVAITERKEEHWKTYFRHHTDTDGHQCDFSGKSRESLLHLKFKEQIAQSKTIHAPGIYITQPCPYPGYTYKPYVVTKAQTLRFEKVVLERRDGAVIPDCIGFIGDRKLHIEVKVTHGVNDRKKQYLINNNLPCIEFCATDSMLKQDLQSALDDPRNFRWIHETKSKGIEAVQGSESWFWDLENQIQNDIRNNEESARQLAEKRDKEYRRPRENQLFRDMMNEFERNQREARYLGDGRTLKKATMPFSLKEFISWYPEDTRQLKNDIISKGSQLNSRQNEINNSISSAMFKLAGSVPGHQDFIFEQVRRKDKETFKSEILNAVDESHTKFIEKHCEASSDPYNAINSGIQLALENGSPPAVDIEPLVDTLYEAVFNKQTELDKIDKEGKRLTALLNATTAQFDSSLSDMISKALSNYPLMKKDVKSAIETHIKNRRLTEAYQILSSYSIEDDIESEEKKKYKDKIGREIRSLSNQELKTKLNITE